MSEIDYRIIAHRLWELLDDIDTAFDHYKPDMKDKFVNYVQHKCVERQIYGSSKDCYTLEFVSKDEIPILDKLDPMCRWFKDAWIIEKDNK
jgi:hypothetical protein